jgi:hypothetical protein
VAPDSLKSCKRVTAAAVVHHRSLVTSPGPHIRLQVVSIRPLPPSHVSCELIHWHHLNGSTGSTLRVHVFVLPVGHFILVPEDRTHTHCLLRTHLYAPVSQSRQLITACDTLIPPSVMFRPDLSARCQRLSSSRKSTARSTNALERLKLIIKVLARLQ